MDEIILWALRIAGAGQIALCAASLAIPRVLGWRDDLASLRPINRQAFWVYAAYIFGFHLCFGLAGLFGAPLLLDGSKLAGLVCAFIAVYWLARLVIQFTYFDRRGAPQGARFVVAEIALVLVFTSFAGVFGCAAAFNLAERA